MERENVCMQDKKKNNLRRVGYAQVGYAKAPTVYINHTFISSTKYTKVTLTLTLRI